MPNALSGRGRTRVRQSTFDRGCLACPFFCAAPSRSHSATLRRVRNGDLPYRSFDLITEEDIYPCQLLDSGNYFHELIGRSYLAYEEALLKFNFSDFSHLLLRADDVLTDDRIAENYGAGTRQIMVDEYQDVSRIMERIVLRVSGYHDNLVVVGDADQSIYRFRGAGPETLLGFPRHFADCRVVTLDTNYRSHPRIVETCNRLIVDNHRNNDDCSDHGSNRLTAPHSAETRPDYPAALTVFGWEAEEELGQLVDIVKFLRRHEVIEDYAQIALLLHSVKDSVSRPYVEAFTDAGVPVYCRAHTSDVAHLDPGHFRNRRRGSNPKRGLSTMTMHASKGLGSALPQKSEAATWEEASVRWRNRNCWRRSETATELRQSGRKAESWTSSSP